jgi:hypothetical protein
MLLIAFIKDPLKCFRNSATYLVGNLALSDLLLNLMLITGMFLESENEVVVFLQYVSFYSSMLTIFSIALDRYLMIAYPFKHRFLMSGEKMAIWIAFIWFLSSVHPVKNIFIRNENDVNAKPGVGLVFILFTAVLYGKTYFALRKQARSMIGKKTTFSSKQSQYAPNKSSSIESETCVGSNNHVKNGIERDQSLDERAQIQYERDEIENERAKSQSERDQSLVERAENKNHRAQNQYERAEIENLRAKVRVNVSFWMNVLKVKIIVPKSRMIVLKIRMNVLKLKMNVLKVTINVLRTKTNVLKVRMNVLNVKTFPPTKRLKIPK